MSNPSTYFASPDRQSYYEISKMSNILSERTDLTMFLNALPDIILVLNVNRQIIFANETAKNALGIEDLSFIGQRPGELISCIHSFETSSGCGTSIACQYCGAVNAVLYAQKEKNIVQRDSRITTISNGRLHAMDFHVSARQVEFENSSVTIVYLKDIHEENRRKSLERIFFHDVLNSIAAIHAGATLLHDEYQQIAPDYIIPMLAATEYLIDEVTKQRDFISMENGDLSVEFDVINSEVFIKELISLFSKSDVCRNKTIEYLGDYSESVIFRSDPVLLRRVISNAMKNALEASEKNQTVSVSATKMEGNLVFAIKNSTVMPDDVKSQVFQRSFSTKGHGRGLGTYSMRVLIQEYLRGSISFVSTVESGTIFRISVPIE